jgi:hypothetical protein
MSRIDSRHWKISTGRHFQNGHHNTAKIQHCPISSKFDMWVDNYVPTLKNFYRSPFSKWPPQYSTNSTLSDFNEISYVGRLWCPELIPDIEKFLPFAIFKMATTIPQNIKLRICHNAKCAFKPVVSGRFGRLHNHYTIIISCYSYYSSSSFFLLPKVCPTHFSATTERKSMKLHRNVKHYE